MKTLYIILVLFVSLALPDQAQAQQLSGPETEQLKKYFDKHLLKVFNYAKLQADASLSRSSNFSTLSDSIHTFSKFAEASPYIEGIKYYFTFELVAGEAIVTAIDIKILDASLPVDNIKAVPTYDSQQRISKITLTSIIFGIPFNVLNYFYNFDARGNTTSIILESPGILGGPTSYQGDSAQISYAGDRVTGYNLYFLDTDVWVFTSGISELQYDGSENITHLTQWLPGGDTLAPVPTAFVRFRDVKWYNNAMPSNMINPLGLDDDNIEAGLTGIEIATADESHKFEPVEYIQSSFIDDEWQDSTTVRTFEQNSGTFSIFDAFYDTGDYIYTEVTNYIYNAENLLTSVVILFDLGIGAAVPLDKIDYEYGEFGLTKAESFTFDQGLWISTDISTFEFVVVNDELIEYTETYVFDTIYESFKTVFFPSDILGTSVNETLLSENVISVFPTVTTGNLTISFPQQTMIQNVMVSIWDISGKILMSEKYDVVAQNFELNVSTLSSGMYLLNVRMPEGIRTIRFVKE